MTTTEEALPTDAGALYNQCGMARSAIAELIGPDAHKHLKAQFLKGPPRELALVVLLEVGMLAWEELERRRTTGLSGLAWRVRRWAERMSKRVQRFSLSLGER